MAATFHVEVVSAERALFSGVATLLSFSTTEGAMGILPGHQPVLASLVDAGLSIQLTDGSRELVAVHRGYVYYSGGDTAVILADLAELANEIDVETERRQVIRIEEMQAAGTPVDLDLPAMLRRSETRIRVAEQANR